MIYFNALLTIIIKINLCFIDYSAKEILKKVTKTIPLKIVDLPHHQYSKYFEKTFGIEEAGVTAEGQLIYPPDGYLPRTGMFNLQGNLLGNSIEIFETMVHVEGAENFISEMAGVDGLLSKDLLVEIFNSTMTFDKIKEMYYRHQNEKQEVKMTGRMNKIHQQVNMEPTKPTAHINIKVMGQEVKVFSYDDLYWLIDEIDNMNVIQLLTDVAKGTFSMFILLICFVCFITSFFCDNYNFLLFPHGSNYQLSIFLPHFCKLYNWMNKYRSSLSLSILYLHFCPYFIVYYL